MSVEVLMPALSPTMTEGNLARWLKAEGDAVAPGDVLAEIETDKATMEVEAVDEGVLGRILVPEGAEDVAVNTPIAVILEEGENAADITTPTPIAAAPVAPQVDEPPAGNGHDTRGDRNSGADRTSASGRRLYRRDPGNDPARGAARRHG